MPGGYEKPEARDVISKDPMNEYEIGAIVDRLHTHHTLSSRVEGPPSAPKLTNVVARGPASEEEMAQIYKRLHSTMTKSRKGGEPCEAITEPKTPGYGLKTFPVIDGIETRFKAEGMPQNKVDEAIVRLHSTQTEASQSRVDNPRVLLYPERTTLMNNVERIIAYQHTGALAKQTVLQRREKWYN